ncbi:MAG: YraN family protein [Clostridiales bacterium]|nr:YraN family protein [Clostridiales bacterium]
MYTPNQTGKIGEEIAAKYLANKGYTVTDRNYRTRRGEIDIVAQKDGLLIFVEVKYRTTTQLGQGTDAVNRSKKQKILNTAKAYIYEKGISPRTGIRFDVIDIYDKEINHFENAFRA